MISILMPIYNGIQFIEESVSSIICQSYTDWELIIGINGNGTNSDVYKIAKKYELRDKRIKVNDLPEHIKGKPSSLNEMIKLCSLESNWVSLLDVDDKWLSKKLELQLPFIKEYDVIGTMCQYFGDNNGSPYIPLYDISKFNFLSFNPIVNSSCLLKKELCYLNNSIVEDYDLWLRLWTQGKKFYNIDSVQVLHRIHQESYFNSKGNHLHSEELKAIFSQNV